MKKIFYSFAILTLVFTSCNPMEDIYEEIDAIESVISGEAKFTLADADYDALDLGYGNFSSLDDAKSMLPDFLAGKYPAWGKESLAEVTFKLYSPVSDERSLEVYTVSSQDYADNGHSYGNFSSASDITDFLDIKYPSPANRLLVSLTYKYYSGSVSTFNNGFLYVNDGWKVVTGFTSDEYATMGEGYPNFSNEDEALTKIPLFLVDKFMFAGKVAGDIESIMYKLYVSGATVSYVGNFIYDGSSWSSYSGAIDETIKFGHDGTTWVPDNTIKYTLIRNADYQYMASQLTSAEYAGLITNLGNYGDFDYNWTDAQINYALSIFLAHLDPNAAEGQKYLLSYVVYDNGENTFQKSFIKTGGEWVIN